jgi:hypothetical protein
MVKLGSRNEQQSISKLSLRLHDDAILFQDVPAFIFSSSDSKTSSTSFKKGTPFLCNHGTFGVWSDEDEQSLPLLLYNDDSSEATGSSTSLDEILLEKTEADVEVVETKGLCLVWSEARNHSHVALRNFGPLL